jgi:hypothetical protein
MQDQFDTTGETTRERAGELPGEQPDMQSRDALTTKDIVSAGKRTNPEPATQQDYREAIPEEYRQADATTAPRYLSGDVTDATDAPMRRDTALNQPSQGDVGHAATPGPQARLNPLGAGVARDERAQDVEGSRAAGAGPDESAMHTAGWQGQGAASSPASLLSSEATGAYQARWDAVQTAFVDNPRRVVEQADSLVAEVMQRLAEMFAQERAHLERQWDQGGDVSTENLRLALQRYRSFFQRLLST